MGLGKFAIVYRSRFPTDRCVKKGTTINCLGHLLLLFFFISLVFGQDQSPISADRLIQHVQYLSSPELAGRLPGTPGCDLAAEYIVKTLAELKLKPMGHPPSFFQPFSYASNQYGPVPPRLGNKNKLQITRKKGKTDYQVLQDFLPFAFSPDGSASGSLVFVGYGISAPQANYDDYEGVDVKGKIVLLFKHEPMLRMGGREMRHQGLSAPSLSAKVDNAKAHGARAVVIVHDYNYHAEGEVDHLQALLFVNEKPVTLPAVQVKREIVNTWLSRSGKHLLDLQRQIFLTHKPASFQAEDLKLDFEVELARGPVTTRNVVAWLEGSDPDLKNETIIVGAHYDHIGFGIQNSSDPWQTKAIHPGANDNASGVASALEIARALSERVPHPKRSTLFLFFSGEEDGLQGAKYYVDHPLVPVAKTVMVNIAEVGLVEGNVVVYNNYLSEGIKKILIQMRSPIFNLNLKEEITQGADHWAFVEKKIPALWITGAGRKYYHMIEDTWHQLNYQDMAELTRTAMEAIANIADLTSPTAEPGLAKDPAFLGIQPAQNDPSPGEGVLVGAVLSNSPASRADLRVNDRIVQCDGQKVAAVEDLKKCLQPKPVGGGIHLKIRRGSEMLDKFVNLSERPYL